MDQFQIMLLLQELVDFSLHMMRMALLQLWPITKKALISLSFSISSVKDEWTASALGAKDEVLRPCEPASRALIMSIWK